MKLPIYMDSHATTPVDPRVVQAMIPCFTEDYGNPASKTHRFGWQAADAVQLARKQVATLIGANPKEIVFTSGATEANNLVLKGISTLRRGEKDHVVVPATEHPSVLDSCKRLERDGFRVTYLGVASDGRIDLERLADALSDRTALVSVMAANNEVGVLQPISDIGRLCRERGVLFHTDAAQAAGKVPFDVEAMNVDLASISGHKMYGPKGVGALYVRRRPSPVALNPLLDGGGQEGGLRSGTLNVPGIVGFGKAADLCHSEMAEEAARVKALRDRLHKGLERAVPEMVVNGSMEQRLPQNLNVSFAEVDGEALLMALDDVAVSSGAACSSAARQPSHVLKAIGVKDDLIQSSIRFGLGRFTTEDEVDYVIAKVAAVVSKLRLGHVASKSVFSNQ